MNNIEDDPFLSGDIRLYSHSGLCNRLRLIIAYKHLSDIKNKKIRMFWVKSRQCNSLFKDLFNPVPNIEFTYLLKPSRPQNTATRLIDRQGREIDLSPYPKEIKNKNHLMFNPIDSIMEEIERTKERIDGEYIACHIRRTDIITIQNKYKVEPPSDEVFERFIEQYPNTKIFLSTDSRTTQQKFISRFGSRLYYACVISGDGSNRWPNRTTGIVDAVRDIFLCIGSKDFIGTPCSTFSDFVESYKDGLRCLNQN